MKKYIYIVIALVAIGSLFSACKKDLKTFEGETGIYFLPSVFIWEKKAAGDSTVISFSYAKSTLKDSVIQIPVMISGPTSTKDRDFKLTIDPLSTAIPDTHYKILNEKFTIPANGQAAIVSIMLHRTADMLTRDYVMILNLESNENFKTTMRDRVLDAATGKKISYIRYKIRLNDILKKPAAWLDSYLGPFSRKKLFLMAETAEIKNIGDLDNTMLTSISKVVFYGTFMQRYLNEMKASGKTIYEEDGKEMRMGDAVQ
ncbi:protein of unknown function [Pedobacter steynii]|uniref:DUF4843 domain-containing protein n=1 Tax=Pedobacter steynii TaxID=430522 RepID=A0A1H0FPM9_9SPHI|nr:DUF4843 domain-containing protein [Pedobacter steynii]NQX42041.1 DUF4843 domain-containing protein [Pedobacter steynii]SDN96605.1 protein of unknown function [Pedobacter steynii]